MRKQNGLPDGSALVTGGCGFIGRAIVSRLLDRNMRVVVLDDLSASSSALSRHDNLEFVEGSVLDEGLVAALVGQSDVTLHLASVVGVEAVMRDPQTAFDVSARGAAHTLHHLEDRRAIFFSSSAVYGLNAFKASDGSLPAVSDCLAYDGGVRGYACGKQKLEFLAAEGAQKGLDVIVIRPFNVVGAGQSGAYGMVLPRFIARSLLGEPLVVYDDGLQRRSFAHVETFVDVMLRLVECPSRPNPQSGAFNIGCPRTTNIIEVIALIRNELGTIPEVRFIGADLLPCAPEAYVHVLGKVARYPLQMHLADLGPDLADRCLRDLLKVQDVYGRRSSPSTFEAALTMTFGETLSHLFLAPYNRKMWARPLASMPPDALQWTTTQPDLEKVKRGAAGTHSGHVAYNARGYYPRPAKHAQLRGMGVVSAALSQNVGDLRLNHRIVHINAKDRVVTAETPNGRRRFGYRSGCVITMPLREMTALTEGLKPAAREIGRRLRSNRVYSVALCVQGDRRTTRGHWRYYADEEVCFTRIVDMAAFDALTAPKGGYGLLAEITQPSENPLHDHENLIRRVIEDARATGDLQGSDDVIEAKCWITDPAYVVFASETRRDAAKLTSVLEARDLHMVGRYGRWEYSSMGQVLRDGHALGRRLAGAA